MILQINPYIVITVPVYAQAPCTVTVSEGTMCIVIHDIFKAKLAVNYCVYIFSDEMSKWQNSHLMNQDVHTQAHALIICSVMLSSLSKYTSTHWPLGDLNEILN